MTPLDEKRKKAALKIVKILSQERSVVAKPLTAVDIVNIPNDAEPEIKKWIRNHKGKHQVYGSSAMATHSFTARRPSDLDLVIDTPRKAAYALANILRNKGHKARVNHDPKWGSYVIQIQKRGEFIDCLDIHPLKGFEGKYDFYGSSMPPVNVHGINIQTASDQLLRKANAITQVQKGSTMGAAKHRNVKDTEDFVHVAEVLISSTEVRSEAERARIQEAKKALGVWKQHLNMLKRGGEKRKEPLTQSKRKRFVRKALQKPETDVDNLIFEDASRITVGTVFPPICNIPSPFAKGPYPASKKRKAKSPYPKSTSKKGKRAKRGGKKVPKLVDVPRISFSFDDAMKIFKFK